ncbi:MAG: hypothetical protein ACRC8A_03645 [Microcoleaceae cyanobacterium]
MITADLGKLPIELLSKVPNYDIIGHFVLYGIASFLSYRALNWQMLVIFNIVLPVGPFLFALVTIAEEMLQQILPNRTFSLVDMGASLLGIIVFYWLGNLWFPQKVT